MLLEDMYRLPVGTHVDFATGYDPAQSGVIEELRGTKYVRWDDGSRTIAFGVARDVDEHMASHILVATSIASRRTRAAKVDRSRPPIGRVV